MFHTFLKFLPNRNSKNGRQFSDSPVCFKEQTEPLKGNAYNLTGFDKRLLVWMGKFKKLEEVPAQVPPGTIEKARSWARIRISNYMMVLTAFGCIAMIYSGKKARDRGESLQQRNLDWHKEYNEKEKTTE